MKFTYSALTISLFLSLSACGSNSSGSTEQPEVWCKQLNETCPYLVTNNEVDWCVEECAGDGISDEDCWERYCANKLGMCNDEESAAYNWDQDAIENCAKENGWL